MALCTTQVNTRRRLFWTTQVGACGTEDKCGVSCGVPGLQAIDAVGGRTFATTEWVRGLIVNMLMTDGREPATTCGYAPGTQGGHWSESYGAGTVGTLMRTVDSKGSINEAVAEIESYASATLERLVERGVAVSVEVTAKYVGSLRMNLDVIVYGANNETATRVGLSAERLENGWVWS